MPPPPLPHHTHSEAALPKNLSDALRARPPWSCQAEIP